MNLGNIYYNINEKIRTLKDIEIVSVAVFGSTARLKEFTGSDIDILVVANGISDDFIQRTPDIIKIKRAFFAGLPLDILLVSKDECILNFRNHNPLYLDIAFDAKTIYDNGFLENLIVETRDYVYSKNIHRGDGSWSFPVDERKATYLSNVSNSVQ